jgi:hypothetical protein
MKLPREELDSTCLELLRAIQSCESGWFWRMNAGDQLMIVGIIKSRCSCGGYFAVSIERACRN